MYNCLLQAVRNLDYIQPAELAVRAAFDAVLGGWQMAWNALWQSGEFFTPSFSGPGSVKYKHHSLGAPNRRSVIAKVMREERLPGL
jgi:hypothetical protein